MHCVLCFYYRRSLHKTIRFTSRMAYTSSPQCMIVLFLSLWLFVCKYFGSWFGFPCILLLIKCMSCSVMCKGCLRCSMEEFSRKFTCSNSCLWSFHSSGQLDEGFLQFESERNVHYLAFIFFRLPIISAWSMVWNS